MGKKSGPAPPPPPDPYATAQAQAGMNRDTAITNANLNRIDQYTPQGSVTYDQIGTYANGDPQYQQTVAYSPEQQQLYQQGVALDNSLTGLAGQNVSRVADVQNTPFSYDGMTPMQTGVQGGQLNYGGTAPTLQTQLGDVGGPQRNLDFSGLNALPGTSDFGAEGRRLADASYMQATSRLDPMFEQQQSDMSSRLANSGIPVGSEAWQREMDNYNRSRTDAYNDAGYRAQQAGANEQSRLFGLSLSARQQGVGEQSLAGNFANDAQNQAFAQGLAGSEFGNSALGNQFMMGQQAAGFNNQTQNQDFNQDLTNANLNNQARQQQIQEATYLRNLPLNEIAALMGTAGGVQNPSFQPFAQVGVAAPDYQNGVYNNYNAQMQQWQTQANNRAAGLGSLFGAVGSIGGALAMSDARTKENIVPVSVLPNGIPLYSFNYIGDDTPQFGAIAQEVQQIMPDAVHVDFDTTRYVDYGKVFA